MTFRIAIVGAGPSGFFLADKLLKQGDVPLTVDLFERLPAPYGLVRYGVAPDHEKIRAVTKAFDRSARQKGFRYWGNVEIGRDILLDELLTHYDQVCFTTGAQTDRRLGIPGEDLLHSYPATEFVAWYNGHPEFREHTFNLDASCVAVIGVGNVAVDVARILCRTPEELARTDIADHALRALTNSKVREVLLLGRRGPTQAAFTTPEVRELGELAGADVRVVEEEVHLDSLSAADLEAEDDAATKRKVEVLQEFAGRPQRDAKRTLTIRFLVSPTEILGDAAGQVRAIRLVKNRLVRSAAGRLSAEPTDEVEEIPVDMVFRSVGYRGVPIVGLPFDDRRGLVPNIQGRVVDSATETTVTGIYVSGWIKRGPSGVIGTNKPDAAETAAVMLEDLSTIPRAGRPRLDVATLTKERGIRAISFADWERIRTVEEEHGHEMHRPRVKFTTVQEMLQTLA